MADTIKQSFQKTFPLVITPAICQKIIHFCYHFETKGTHPEALNTPLIGVSKIFFLSRDQDEFYDIFDVQQNDIRRLNLSTLINRLAGGDVKRILDKLEVVNTDRKVQSDPFNIFMIWVLYQLTNTKIADDLLYQTQLSVLKILQYKFFTSLVGRRFQHGATESVMQSVIAGLSNKYAIVQHGTWKKVIEARAVELLKPESIHSKTIKSFHEDLAIFYLITDIQTRVRNQINLITTRYYLAKEKGDTSIGSYSSIGSDLDGKKIILSNVATLDAMIGNLSGEILNTRQFIDIALVGNVCKLFEGLNPNMFQKALEMFSQMAVIQSKEGHLDLIKKVGGKELYVGGRILVANILQKFYRHCMQNKVDMTSRIQILRTVKDAASSSRIIDQDILVVRDSVALVIDQTRVTQRPATKASLRIAFILYLLIKSFDYL